MEGREYKPGADWVVQMSGDSRPVTVTDAGDWLFKVTIDGATLTIDLTKWRPGDVMIDAAVDGVPMPLKVTRITDGYRIAWRGASRKVFIRSPRVAELAALMPEKLPPDTSKMLLCPMPGLVMSIAVAEGDEVQEGQALCTVEAMKMENVLRAERKGIVSAIKAEPGDSLAVDAVIMEFE